MRNIGFDQATKDGEYDCVIFHDVDILPEVEYNYYGCPDVPRHMCIAVSYCKYKPERKNFGGIVAFRTDHFKAANGYSNVFFGWEERIMISAGDAARTVTSGFTGSQVAQADTRELHTRRTAR